MPRRKPNIIITGTPGVGKTTHAEQLARNLNYTHLSINALVKTHNLHSNEHDLATASLFVDEDLLLDHLETLPIHEDGGYIIDWHACDLFPERWIDLVVVLRCGTEVHYDRLTGPGRAYEGKKLEENVDAEIMGVVMEEAREGYKEEVVVELTSETTQDLEANLERVEQWVKGWIKDNSADDAETDA